MCLWNGCDGNPIVEDDSDGKKHFLLVHGMERIDQLEKENNLLKQGMFVGGRNG